MDTMVRIIRSANADVFERLLLEYLQSISNEYTYDVHYQDSMIKNTAQIEHSYSALIISRRKSNV